MLIRKIFAALILILNLAGIGFLLFVGFRYLWERFFTQEDIVDTPVNTVKKKKPEIVNDDIVLDEDDLLKDMDLSDLDDLDLDDFD